MYVNRTYRDTVAAGLKSFRTCIKETDLFISVDEDSFSEALVQRVEKKIIALRYDLESYIDRDPEFKVTLNPHMLLPGAPAIAQTMAVAANAAGVGPMAAVAGAFAEYIGRDLLTVCSEVIVENGGDIFMSSVKNRLVGVFAGASPFTGRIAINIPAGKMPLGVCTSSGTVGPSLSLGKADAAIIISGSTALADAVASAAGNAVQAENDVKNGIEVAKAIPGVLGAFIIKGDQLAAWGDFSIVRMAVGETSPRVQDPR